MDRDIFMDIYGKSVYMDIDMDGKFYIHGKPMCENMNCIAFASTTCCDAHRKNCSSH